MQIIDGDHKYNIQSVFYKIGTVVTFFFIFIFFFNKFKYYTKSHFSYTLSKTI